MTSPTRFRVSTKSTIWQSVLPVPGDNLMPRPICGEVGCTQRWERTAHDHDHTICENTFLDRVGRATITQSTFGISAPSVSIAVINQSNGLPLGGALESGILNLDEPQLTRTGNFPARKSSSKVFRSSIGVLECKYLASTPPSRKVFVNSTTCAIFTQNTRVDFREANEMPQLVFEQKHLNVTHQLGRATTGRAVC